MLARQQEVFAGFLTHTDAQIGRVLSSLESLGVMDNTLVMVFSDNGASAEGGKDGSVNEHRFTAHVRESMADNLAHYDDWGGFTHLQPLLVGLGLGRQHPAQALEALHLAGRDAHAADRALGRPHRAARAPCAPSSPTPSTSCPRSWPPSGSTSPTRSTAWPSSRSTGSACSPTLEDPGAAELHHTQYFEMLGSRSIYHEGWKATTNHISTGVLDEEELAVGSRNFDEDRWELFDLTADFSEATDRADDEPERLRQLRDLWDAEAERNNVLPISDGLVDRFGGFIPPAWPAGSSRTFLPGGGPVADESVPLLWGGFRMTADDRRRPGRRERRDLRPRRLVRGLRPLRRRRRGPLHLRPRRRRARAGRAGGPVPRAATTSASSTRSARRAAGPHGAARRRTEVDETTVEGMLPLAVQHGGAGLRLGCDSGFPVSAALRAAGAVHGHGAPAEHRHAGLAAARPGRRGARRAARRLTPP